MKAKAWLAPALIVGAALLGWTLRAQAQGVGAMDIGHFQALAGPYDGFLDCWDGTIYMVDPQDKTNCLAIDLPHAGVKITPLVVKNGKWNVPAVLKGPALPSARERNYSQVGDRLAVMDTRSGDTFAFEGGIPPGPAAKWVPPMNVVFSLTNPMSAIKVLQ